RISRMVGVEIVRIAGINPEFKAVVTRDSMLPTD
ncbi:MAG: hypothetical protein ACI9JN_002409, partial [Bacteroidia bacterium]